MNEHTHLISRVWLISHNTVVSGYIHIATTFDSLPGSLDKLRVFQLIQDGLLITKSRLNQNVQMCSLYQAPVFSALIIIVPPGKCRLGRERSCLTSYFVQCDSYQHLGTLKRWLRDEDPFPALAEVLSVFLTSQPGSSLLPKAPLSGNPTPLASSGSCIHIYIPTH